MDFSLPDTHHDIRKLAGEILGDYGAPERLKKLEADGPYFDRDLWRQLVDSGLHAASLPETLGGLDLDYAATAMATEALGESVVSIPYIPCVVSTALPLLAMPAEEAIQAALKTVVSGEGLLTAAHIEPGNEDPLQPTATATRDGDGWRVSGVKHCVPYAAEAESILVGAVADGELWAGLVPVARDGVRLEAQLATTGEPQYAVTLEQAEAQGIARGEAALLLLQKSVAMTTVAYCSMAVGVADRMIRIAGEYTSQRQQFDTVIATFQAVAHRLADCYIDAECLRIATQKAVSDVNEGHDTAASIATAKVWCGDVLHRVSQATQHVHGGAGIDRDYHLWRYCLWAKHLELALGSSRSHLARLADRLETEYLTHT